MSRLGEEAPLPGVDDLALRPERAGNVYGAEVLGFTRSDAPLATMRAGDVLIVVDEELAGDEPPSIRGAASIIVIGTTLPAWARQGATVVLPTANYVEEEGTVTNLRGRVQRFFQAKAPPGFARPAWYVLADLVAAAGAGPKYSLASEVFTALATTGPQFAGMSYDALGLRGQVIAGEMTGMPA